MICPPGCTRCGLRASGQYALALRAYQHANRLATAPTPRCSPASARHAAQQGARRAEPRRPRAYFERALQIDPKSPKALFYSALIAYQAGQLRASRAIASQRC